MKNHVRILNSGRGGFGNRDGIAGSSSLGGLNKSVGSSSDSAIVGIQKPNQLLVTEQVSSASEDLVRKVLIKDPGCGRIQ